MMASTWENRKVLVTGATGLVGSWLVKRLLKEGSQVFAFVLDSDPRAGLELTTKWYKEYFRSFQ